MTHTPHTVTYTYTVRTADRASAQAPGPHGGHLRLRPRGCALGLAGLPVQSTRLLRLSAPSLSDHSLLHTLVLHLCSLHFVAHAKSQSPTAALRAVRRARCQSHDQYA